MNRKCIWLSLLYVWMCLGAQINWEIQRYDGWYNNLAYHSRGSKGSKLMRLIPASYSDGVYQVATEPELPNPRKVSNAVISGKSGSSSSRNLTVMAVFFGYHVLSEIVSTEMAACPAEFLNIYIPPGDPVFDPTNKSNVVLPFQRIQWSKDTGTSPNSPRDQINKVTAWIDGSSIYGTSHSWSDALRSFSKGKLATGPEGHFPPYASQSLPMWRVRDPSTGNTGSDGIYSFGNAMGNESPFIQAVGLVWFRYHNYIAEKLSEEHSDWTDEVLFQNARKWVIAVYQNIVFYEWLPTFLSDVPGYNGYKPHVATSISPEFLALTAQMIYTMMPSGVYMRDKHCTFLNVTNKDGGISPALRLCNNYWNRKNPNMKNPADVDNLLLGMCSQIAEKEDNIVVPDLKDYWYGQIKYSRTDLLAASVLRGRDMGLPSYKKLREHFVSGNVDWDFINNTNIREQLKALYGNDIGKLELIPGILSEIDGSPGPLISEIVLSQFIQIREGDRFWFENKKNGLFTDEEISKIHNSTFRDVLLAVTDAWDNTTQNNVFIWMKDDPCPQPRQLTSEDMENCVPLTVTDYFEGCAVGFGITIAALCCLPIVSLLIALGVAKYRKQTFLKMQPKTEGSGHSSMNNREGFPAMEWCGGDEPLQNVFIQLHQNKMIKVVDGKKSKTRTIKLQNQQNVEVTLSNNNGSKVTRVKIPKEYDLVLFFNGSEDRTTFTQTLQEFFDESGITYTVTALRENDLLKESVSKKKRQEMLETFFRNSLSHVFDIEKKDSGVIPKQEISEALNCELSREEFADSLGLDPNAHFVEAMFSIGDKDCNGYLSFHEFCYLLCFLLKGSVESKLKFMFSVHDVNETGFLTKEEFTHMLRSFNQLSNFLSKDQTEQVIESMFSEAGLQSAQEITWEQFYSMFKQHSNILNQMTIQGSSARVKGYNSKISFIDKRPKGHTDRNGEIRMDILDVEGQELRNRHGKINKYKVNKPRVFTTARREKYESSKIRQKIQQFKRLIENYRRHIVCLVIFYGISAGLFTERGYYYGFASPGTGIADITYVGLIASRGSAACISFMFSYILLTMCRNLITFLRETFLNQYIPFDAAVDFHRLIAMSALVLTIIHTLGHIVNVYIFTITPLSVLSCLFPTVFADNGSELPQKYYWWVFETVPGMTGVLLLTVMALMYVFSTYYFRRVSFRGFWIIHHLYVLFYILTIIHGSFALIQQPKFHIFFIAPAIMFACDKMISLRRKKIEIEVLDVKQLPSGVTYLKFQRPSDFDYKSGQWVRIACLSLGTNEYHPFTLTSAPHEETLSLHIRAVGPWTTSLRQLCPSPNTTEVKFPKLFLDGPFGEGHQEWNKFEVSVLVGGGIGVTPFASILKDLVFKSSVNAKINCKKIYFIWVTRTQRQFEWLTDIIGEVEENDKNDLLSVHIYITQLSEKFDFRTAMLYICEQHFQKVQSKSLMTGLRSVTHFGRPPFLGFLNSLQEVHPEVKKIGVFSCGPPGMTKNVEDACKKLNKRDQAHFMHHYENF
ncbi:dual oxidase 1-like isoform X2 [Hyla sarda]|uniref:dual oxidase 1-like isoform X2 n=1 Tax=Hyla sarda TaxID=327740 RepID=UPI0024C384D4|nr:dual oxidase 1-like isoform X2 [Hyla sarda]XP_056428538.1 dual oxidase 1-like isoform X2 [Hyla sarda]